MQGGGVDALVQGPVGDRQPPASGQGAHVHTQRADLGHHGVAHLPQVIEVAAGADVHVQTDQIEVVLLDLAQGLVEVRVPDAVLAPLAARVRLAAVTVAEARVDPDPHPVSGATAPELSEHVGGARVHGEVQVDHSCERRLVEDVCGVDEPGRLSRAVEAGPHRPLDLTQRHRVHQAPFGAQQPQEVHVRAGFLGVANHVERAQRRNLLANHLRVVDVERRAVAVRQLDEPRCVDPLRHVSILGCAE